MKNVFKASGLFYFLLLSTSFTIKPASFWGKVTGTAAGVFACHQVYNVYASYLDVSSIDAQDVVAFLNKKLGLATPVSGERLHYKAHEINGDEEDNGAHEEDNDAEEILRGPVESKSVGVQSVSPSDRKFDLDTFNALVEKVSEDSTLQDSFMESIQALADFTTDDDLKRRLTGITIFSRFEKSDYEDINVMNETDLEMFFTYFYMLETPAVKKRLLENVSRAGMYYKNKSWLTSLRRSHKVFALQEWDGSTKLAAVGFAISFVALVVRAFAKKNRF